MSKQPLLMPLGKYLDQEADYVIEHDPEYAQWFIENIAKDEVTQEVLVYMMSKMKEIV